MQGVRQGTRQLNLLGAKGPQSHLLKSLGGESVTARVLLNGHTGKFSSKVLLIFSHSCKI